jgi:hypothetical protein
MGVARYFQAEHQVPVSGNTARRVLKVAGLKAIAKVKKPLLRPKHIRDRLAWAKKYESWTVDDWKRVVWSDETKINRLGYSDGRKWCWKEPGRAREASHVVGTVKHGGGSLMLWACMTWKGPGFMARIDGGLDGELYRDILADELQHTIEWYGLDRERLVFQHDNDPKHTAKDTRDWLAEHRIEVLDWPAQSPDLNPIEHLWNVLKKRLNAYDEDPTSIFELWERIQAEWEKITASDCMHLIESMPRRAAEVIKVKGKYTKY